MFCQTRPDRKMVHVGQNNKKYDNEDRLRIFTKPDTMRQRSDCLFVWKLYMPGLHVVSRRNKLHRKTLILTRSGESNGNFNINRFNQDITDHGSDCRFPPSTPSRSRRIATLLNSSYI